MSYRFGLRITPTRAWLETRWADFGSEDRDRFVRDVLLQPDRHLLPLLDGKPEQLAPLRAQHLDRLREVFGEEALVAALRGELDPILDDFAAAEGGQAG